MSIKFKKITLKNFLSYGKKPTKVLLDRPGRTTFVLGKDLDDTASGTGGNGVGKTAILNALVFAIYNKPVSNIAMERLVNNVNLKDMEVTVQFEKDGDHYMIRRIRKGKTGASVHLYEEVKNPTSDDVIIVVDGINYKDTTPDSIKLTSKKIERIMGVPYELFVRIVAFSANHKPFLDLPNTHVAQANQKDIIEELFEITILSDRAKDLKEVIKNTEADLKMQRSHIEQLRKEHERHKKQIVTTEERVNNWAGEIETERKTIIQKLKKVEGINIDEQHQLHTIRDELDGKIQIAYQELKTTEGDIKKTIIKRKQAEGEIEILKKAECPYCGQEFHDNEMKILEQEAILSDCIAEMENGEDALVSADAKIERLESNRKEIEEKIEIDNVRELLDIRSKQDQYNDRLKHLKVATNPHLEPLEDLKSIKLEDIDLSRIEEMEDEIMHQKFLLKGLTKNDSFMRKKLLNKKVPFLNQRIAKYLGILGLTHSVRFTEDMTVNISRFGRELDFGQLSNGQQARLNFAISLGFRDMLEKVHGTINVYMLDEVLDVGLDAIGIQAAAKLLKNKARDENLSVYIISHKDELSNAFDKQMYVTMTKGFSYIEEQ